MSKNEIIQQLFVGKNFTDVINKMEPGHLRDDLRQDIILRICELPDDKVIGLHTRGELEFYTARVIINELRNKYNGFSKKYMQSQSHVSDQELANKPEDEFLEEERVAKELLEDLAISEIDNLNWYDAEIVRLYLKHKNYRAIQRETGIPYSSVFKTVQKAIRTIRSRVQGPSIPVFTKEELKQIAI